MRLPRAWPWSRGWRAAFVPHQRGAVILTVTFFLMLMLGFAALGVEVGRWFLVRAELSKSVDAAALAGARNISNPYLDPRELAAEMTEANFPLGSLGTPASGPGSATFDIQLVNGKVIVKGKASALPILSQVVGIGAVPVGSSGAAMKRDVEIMMVLDRSGSMANQPIADLKVAAKSFLDFFQDTQTSDRMGLISFSTAVTVDRAMGFNYVPPMKAAIDAMNAQDYTNSEDAIDQADGPSGFTNQNGLPAENRVQQFMIFFSDGRPNTFRWTFKRSNVTYDAVVHANGNCDFPTGNGLFDQLYRPTGTTEQKILNVFAMPTGDGVSALSKCAAEPNTRWNVFDVYPVPGHGPTDCGIPPGELGDHICGLAAALAVQHAKELKDAGVIVYAIGLGTKINDTFLREIATSDQQVYMAPSSSELQAIFQKVAKDIKLRLVD